MKQNKLKITIFRFEFKRQDLWIGIFWKKVNITDFPALKKRSVVTNIYICFIPMFPLHVEIMREY